MELIIKIPQWVYESVKDGTFDAKRSPYDLEYVLKYGKPLPKGHGRLIDADATIEIQSGTHFEVIVGKAKIEKRSIDEIIKASNSEVPTIIEANKEETKTICPYCGAEQEKGYDFCTECGAPSDCESEIEASYYENFEECGAK